MYRCEYQHRFLWIRTVFLLSFALLLNSCGGGGNGGGGGSGSGQQGQTSSSAPSSATAISTAPTVDTVTPANGMTVTVTDSGLVIEKIFKPSVYLFADNSNVTQTSDTQFEFGSLPPSFAAGSVFTFWDEPWVATAVTRNPNGTATATVRPANYDEVLSDLKIQGTVTLEHLDSGRLVVMKDPAVQTADAGITTTPQLASAGPRIDSLATRLLANRFFQVSSNCKFSFTPIGKPNGLSCSFNRPTQADFISLHGSLGITDVKLNLNVFGTQNHADTATEFKATSGAGFDISSSAPGGNVVTLTKTIPLLRAVSPILYTLGFARLDVPIAGEFSLPALTLSVGFDGTLPYKNGFQVPTGKFNFLSANVDTQLQGVGFSFSNLFAGIKTGIVFVQTSLPLWRPTIIFGEDDSNIIASEGVTSKLGAQFTLTGKLNPLCLEYKGNYAVGVSAVANIRNPLHWSEFLQKSFDVTQLIEPGQSGSFPAVCATSPPPSLPSTPPAPVTTTSPTGASLTVQAIFRNCTTSSYPTAVLSGCVFDTLLTVSCPGGCYEVVRDSNGTLSLGQARYSVDEATELRKSYQCPPTTFEPQILPGNLYSVDSSLNAIQIRGGGGTFLHQDGYGYTDCTDSGISGYTYTVKLRNLSDDTVVTLTAGV
jgi:hypothetical protein